MRLEVYDAEDVCTASHEMEQHVHTQIHFCGDLELPDQDPSECECMTTYDLDENGEVVATTEYRWRDRWGNKYCNLSLSGNCENNMSLLSGEVLSTPEPDCQAGYFHLYFAELTVLGVPLSISTEQQTLFCQVFADFAELLAPADPNTVVNIRIYPFSAPGSSILAIASSYYDFNPLITSSLYSGLVWQAINTTSTDPNMLHGYIELNTAFNYYTGFDPLDISLGEFDLYGLIQHEILHALGFATFIDDFSGVSVFSENTFTTFDSYLLNNGNPVLINQGPGMNYQSNPIADNCVDLRFDNVLSQSSPMNSVSNGAFYKPGHFDDNCTNITLPLPPYSINNFYVSNPFFDMSDARRMQQEEVDALCKLGYVVGNQYGTATLNESGLTNPNSRPYNACTLTGTGGHFSACNDQFFTFNDYYTISCIESYEGPYTLNLLNDPNNPNGNDFYPAEAIIVELTDLQTNTLVPAANLLSNGFIFEPENSGLHYYLYRLFHPPTQSYSNYALVGIYVSFCSTIDCDYADISGCNLICNPEFQVDECVNIPSVPQNYNAISGWRSTVGTPFFMCPFEPATSMNEGGAMAFYSTSNQFYSGFQQTEFIGQDLTLNVGTNYLASFYFTRYLLSESSEALNMNSNVTIRFEYGNQSELPLNPNSNFNVPEAQDIIFETYPVTSANQGIWMQAVNTFTPLVQRDLVHIGVIPNEGFSMIAHLVDRIELIVDDFTAGEDIYILCDETVILSNNSCMGITNLTYAWYELDNLGNPISPPIAVNTDAVVNPTTTTSYRLVRYIANQGNPNNNGYMVQNAGSLYADDDMTVFVELLSGGCDFSFTTDPLNCSVTFSSENINGTHIWDFGDGNTSSDVNPVYTYSTNGIYTVTHTVQELGCECSHQEVIFINCCNNSSTTLEYTQCSGTEIILPELSQNGVTGSWSPAINNTQTTTYTFTPDDPNCTSTTNVTFVILPNIEPEFTPINAYCQWSDIDPLPTISLNGIEGFWSPAINNEITSIYTFTPLIGQCATIQTQTIEIVNFATPIFESLLMNNLYCEGDFIDPFPTVSTNGIIGSWLPNEISNIAVDETLTTTNYYFIPDENECANGFALSISISPIFESIFEQVGPFCSGEEIPDLPNTSISGVFGSWSPEINNLETTTYTFTPFSGNNYCAEGATMTIEIFDPQPASFAAFGLICQNTNFMLPVISQNGAEGTWSPAFSSANIGTSAYTFTPILDCFEEVTIDVTIIPCGDCENAPGIHLFGVLDEDLPSGTYRVIGDIEISGTVLMDNCVLAMDPNVNIYVPENSVLTIDRSHLYGCFTLWNGIQIFENGYLNIINSSLIEDAKTAVDIAAYNSVVSGSRVVMSDVMFNKNVTGIKINGYPFANSNEVFDLTNCSFSNRIIASSPSQWPSFNTFNSLNPSASINNFVNPRINPNVYPNGNMLLNMSVNGVISSGGTGTLTGLWLIDVGNYTINTNSIPEFNCFDIGNTQFGTMFTFDRMTNGIKLMRTNLRVLDAVFQGTHHSPSSYGIFAEANTPMFPNVLYNPYIGIVLIPEENEEAVKFYNLSNGVHIVDYTHVSIDKAIFRSNRTTQNSNNGSIGVYYKSIRAEKFHFNNNKVHNINSGVYAQIGHPTVNNYKIDLVVDDNLFSRVLPLTTGIISSAAIQIVGIDPIANFNVLNPSSFRITNNAISGVRRGIYVNNIGAHYIRVNLNTVSVEEQFGTDWQPNARYWGIHLRNVNTMGDATVYENNVVGFNSVNTQLRAYWFDNTSPFAITCNTASTAGAGFYFYGNSFNRWRHNNMHMHRYGLWLDGNAIIGQQGAPNSAAGNTWSGAGATAWTPWAGLQPPTTNQYRIKTYVSQWSFANNSPMYVLPLSNSNPSDSWARETPDLFPYWANSNPQSVFLTNVLQNSQCEDEEPSPDDPAGLALSGDVIAFNEYLLAVEQVLLETGSNSVIPHEVIREHLTYDYIYDNQHLRDSSAVLDTFYINRESENIGKLREMSERIEEKDYIEAENLRNQILPTNIVEQAYREVLTLQMKYEQGLFTVADSADLSLWAHSCYYLYGKSVTLAQNVFNRIYNSAHVFDEDCPLSLPRSVALQQGEKVLDVVLYPNPNSGVLYASANEENLRKAKICIRTSDGKTVFEGDFHFLRGLNLSNLNMSSGVYTVEMRFEERDEIIVRKLVFVK